MPHDILVWLLELIRRAQEPILTSTTTGPEAVEVTVRGRRFRILVEAVA